MERNCDQYESFNNGGSRALFSDLNSSNETTTTTFNSMFSGVSLLSLLAATANSGEPHLFGDPFSPPPTSDLTFLKTPKLEPNQPPLSFNDHLPDLLSLEHPREEKRARIEQCAAMVPRGSALQRQRRSRLSEKTRCLQRVLPWDTKMDMATMLGETYKYVRFLEAQVAALAAMPEHGGGGDGGGGGGEGVYGGLERLSRNQVLQVVVNSPVAQTTLYSKGWCVFSAEQLGAVERVVAQMRRTRGTDFLLPSSHFSSF